MEWRCAADGGQGRLIHAGASQRERQIFGFVVLSATAESWMADQVRNHKLGPRLPSFAPVEKLISLEDLAMAGQAAQTCAFGQYERSEWLER